MHFMQKESNQEAPQSYNGPYGADPPGHPQTANTTKSDDKPQRSAESGPKARPMGSQSHECPVYFPGQKGFRVHPIPLLE